MGDKHENPVSGYYVILYPDPMFKHGFGEAKVGVNKEIPGSNTKILGTLFSNKPINHCEWGACTWHSRQYLRSSIRRAPVHGPVRRHH